MRWMWSAPLILGLVLGAWSCGPTHCGYNGGDAACAARDANTPFCDLCTGDNDGCLGVAPSDAACVLVGDSGTADTLPPPATQTTAPVESTSEPDPTTMGPGPAPETSDPTTTTEPPDPSTTSSESTSTADDTTSTTADDTTSTSSDDTTSTSSDDTTSTTADDTTGPPPPMCGNDVVEDGEVCDGSDLGGKSCTDFPGLGGGTLVCDELCSEVDLAGCCLANGQACASNGECCNNSCKFDLVMFKNICK